MITFDGKNAGDSKLAVGMLKYSCESDSEETKQSTFSTLSNSCSI